VFPVGVKEWSQWMGGMTRIVIIDDRMTNRRILAKLAATLEENVEVKAFADPTKALSWIEDKTPDLVITDYKMPKLDGAEFVRRFRQLPDCFDVPVIVVTVYEDREFRYRSLDAGATDFLLSPVDHQEFWARSRNLLALHRHQQTIKNRAYSLEQRLATSHQLHEETVKEIEGRLRTVMDAVPAMIYATDTDCRLVFLNSYALALSGTAREAAVGATAERVFGRAFGHVSQASDLMLFTCGEVPPPFEECLFDTIGRKREMLATKSALRDSSGRVMHAVTVAIDITERKRAERKLVEAMKALESANHAQSEFLANMSHELRTPLNAIIGFAEIMAKQLLGPIGTPRYAEYALDIHTSALHLLGIINEVLDLAKVEAGRLELVEAPIAVETMIGSAVRLFEERAQVAGVTLKTALSPPLPTLRGDERKVKQILLNLLSNAIKFTPAGGRVTVCARALSDHSIELAVADNGIGMTPEEITVAVTRFGQVESSMTRKHLGVGLGLPLVMSLSDLHDAHCDIKSEKGIGTTVTVRFPPTRTIGCAEAGDRT
jgi:PAS domain S-box-containing protein